MYEKILQIHSGILSVSVDDLISEDPATAPGDVSATGSDAHSASVSDSDILPVSGSDPEAGTHDAQDVFSGTLGYQAYYSPDNNDALDHIAADLDIIVFLLIFFWCCTRIKSAVRLFVGRSHYE